MHSFTKKHYYILLIWILLIPAACKKPEIIPVHLEMVHQGTFFEILRTMEEPCILVNIDHHSDIMPNDYRTTIQALLLEKNRNTPFDVHQMEPFLQNYNWISPLFPSLVTEVLWVNEINPADSATRAQKDPAYQVLMEQNVFPEMVDLRNNFSYMDFPSFLNWIEEENRPIHLTIDLDFFASFSREYIISSLNQLAHLTMEKSNIKSVTIAVSLLYLKSKKQALFLIKEALKAFHQPDFFQLEWDPVSYYGINESFAAREYREEGLDVPRLNHEDYPEEFRLFFSSIAGDVAIKGGSDDFINQ